MMSVDLTVSNGNVPTPKYKHTHLIIIILLMHVGHWWQTQTVCCIHIDAFAIENEKVEVKNRLK